MVNYSESKKFNHDQNDLHTDSDMHKSCHTASLRIVVAQTVMHEQA